MDLSWNRERILSKWGDQQNRIIIFSASAALGENVGLLREAGFLAIELHARPSTGSDWKITAKKDNSEELKGDDDWDYDPETHD